ncbi:class I SAM-dependent rRNA methyltransferase [Myxococcota bacterium]|nr:class I SAM-dependent rRNA methyltransferase [Myxococcota bacterium]MBU1535529.1 class I SAM-dependent rRNA methyltransferase [Myxococcota bacterium]
MKPTSRTPAKKPPGAVTRRAMVKLEDRGVKAIRSGHPWVYRNAILNEDLVLKQGEVVPLHEIDGRFIATGIYAADGAIAFRIMSQEDNITPDDSWLRTLASRALARREILRGEDTNAIRLVNGEADNLPGLTVTRFGDWLLAIQYLEGMDHLTEVVVEQLQKELGLKGAYKQNRLRPSGSPDMQRIPPSRRLIGEEAPLEIEVMEGGIRHLVDITAPMGVGFFPDYREGRKLVRQIAPGRRALNLFSYTGAFGLAALAGGATEVVNVDSSQKANTKAFQNAQLNDFSADRFHTVTNDIFRALNEMVVRGERFDLAIVDPPSFSKGKGGTWSSSRDYTTLVKLLLRLMEPASYILFTSNMAKLAIEEFERSIALGSGTRTISIIQRVASPFDYPELPGFPEGSYLKSLLTRVE